ncbi:SDR family oxidoreductase [Roseateles oligotrophus]|uniref:SDR family oxidoreductase n=1 Tax=Roseateles oligotrophus TaxID=1769250 RepID=A0ABT2YCL7_9BURK|nr:SDR family oxidoreductase [Roseateles oligotrophus]MCV2367790.1 SDR family oxidoreductase [Roseateles oligotrophus]
MKPIVLITGGSRGIGAATALLCARAGYDVAINYAHDAAAADAVAEQVRSLGVRALTVRADVSDEAQVLAMFERVDAELGPLSALVNNAGVVAAAARLDEMSLTRWQRVFGVNVIGSLLCARAAVMRMSRLHGGAGGVIVNVSSRVAQLGSPGIYVDYAASKGAIDSLTLGLARELIGEGIRVNGVRPGIIDTEIHASGGMADLVPGVAATLPIGRMGSADEVAQSIVWLMSAASSYCVGTLLDVGGGR